jgi:hypothetical protein
MTDISMCQNKTCGKHLECYRYLATPNLHWQSYSSFTPDEYGKCEYFVKYEKENKHANQ